MSIKIMIDLHYNQDKSLAHPDFPELGNSPHPQEVMQALGITYEDTSVHPVVDTWVFYNCSAVPNCKIPHWLTIEET